MLRVDLPRSSGLPCPQCQSEKTVLTERRFGKHRWFCSGCEHSWVLDGDLRAAPSIRSEASRAQTPRSPGGQ